MECDGVRQIPSSQAKSSRHLLVTCVVSALLINFYCDEALKFYTIKPIMDTAEFCQVFSREQDKPHVELADGEKIVWEEAPLPASQIKNVLATR